MSKRTIVTSDQIMVALAKAGLIDEKQAGHMGLHLVRSGQYSCGIYTK